MKYLIKRSLRVIKDTFTQFLAIILIIAIGSAIFTGLLSTIRNLDTYLSTYYKEYRLADAWIYVSGMDSQELLDYQNQYPDLLIEGRYRFQVDTVLHGSSVTYRFLEPSDINRAQLITGSLPINDTDILLDRSFALSNGLAIEDDLAIVIDNETYHFIITGLFESPEFAYKSKDNSDAASDKKGLGIIYTNHQTLIELNHHSIPYLEAKVTITDELTLNQAKLEDALVTLNSNQKDLDSNKASTLAKLQSQKDSLLANYQSIQDAYTALELLALNPAIPAEQIAAQKAILDGQNATILSGLSQVNSGISTANHTFGDAQNKLNEGFDNYYANLASFNIEKVDALATLEAITSNYYEILVEGNTQALKTRFESDTHLIKWIDRSSYPSFAMIDNIMAPIEVMTSIFPLLFFLVASILILISMSKTIEHDRTQIAIMKALGLNKNQITLSYLFYGWWAALLGSVIFSLVGNYVVPVNLFNIFTTRFSLPDIEITYYFDLMAIAVVLAIFFASISIIFALRHVLHEIPASGMRPKALSKSKRSLLEKVPFIWKRLKYTQKLIVRNILQGSIKILLSSVGVTGAITLLITGLSLQISANVMINNTVDSYDFDATIHMRQDYDPYAQIDLPIAVETIEPRKNVYATFETDSISLYALIPNQSLMHLQSVNEHKIEVTANSVIIPRNMSILYDLKIGDTMQIEIDKAFYDLKITDIDKQNLGKNVYVSFNMFESMGLSTQTRDFMISTLDEVDTTALLNDPNVLSVDTKQKMIDRTKEILSMLSRIILIIVFSAAALTVTVIYNLASINIIERERELATLRVLGYSVKEVKKLINIENYLLVLLGSIGGIPMGIILYKVISELVSTNEFMMISDTDIMVIIASVVSAFAFTALTNFILEFKIRKIALVEALKAVE